MSDEIWFQGCKRHGQDHCAITQSRSAQHPMTYATGPEKQIRESTQSEHLIQQEVGMDRKILSDKIVISSAPVSKIGVERVPVKYEERQRKEFFE